MQLSTNTIHHYRRSLKAWMGYCADTNYATLHSAPLLQVLEGLLEVDSGSMADFLRRYPKGQRDRRRREVRYVILLWLADLAL